MTRLGVRYVRTRLIPLVILTLIEIIAEIVWANTPVTNTPQIAATSMTFAILMIITTGFNAWLYYERIQAFCAQKKKLRWVITGYLGIRFLILTISTVGGIIQTINVHRSNPDDLQTVVASSPWIQASQASLIILPAVQALIVDCPIMWIILKLFRKQGMRLDVRRLVRMAVLIVFSLFYIGIYPRDVWGISHSLWPIMVALDLQVCTDLYVLDMSFFRGMNSEGIIGTSKKSTQLEHEYPAEKLSNNVIAPPRRVRQASPSEYSPIEPRGGSGGFRGYQTGMPASPSFNAFRSPEPQRESKYSALNQGGNRRL